MGLTDRIADNADRRNTLVNALSAEEKAVSRADEAKKRRSAMNHYQKQADMLINGLEGRGEGAVYYERAAAKETDPERKKQFEQMAKDKRAEAKKWLDKIGG